MHSHPNNRIGIDTQCNTIVDLVLEPIEYQGLQYEHPNTTGKMVFCTGSKPIRYKCGRAFVPGEIPGTNATHLYRAGVQMCPPPDDMAGGICTGWRHHMVQMLIFLFYVFLFSNVFA
jgi:hypothetical protein